MQNSEGGSLSEKESMQMPSMSVILHMISAHLSQAGSVREPSVLTAAMHTEAWPGRCGVLAGLLFCQDSDPYCFPETLDGQFQKTKACYLS